ncbi:hypothetical protein C8R42DRAFT_134526 [Lentinula raphanica]|nr:hypothetical protein C8R42DRAFT_134526 [Lentinula raphanica]
MLEKENRSENECSKGGVRSKLTSNLRGTRSRGWDREAGPKGSRTSSESIALSKRVLGAAEGMDVELELEVRLEAIVVTSDRPEFMSIGTALTTTEKAAPDARSAVNMISK